MKKRAFIIVAACMLLMGCGKAAENQSPLPSIEAGVNEPGASEDSAVGVDENSTGGSDSSEASVPETDSDNYQSADNNDYSSDSDNGVSPGAGSADNDTDRDYDETSAPATTVNSPSSGSDSNSNAGNDSAYDADTSSDDDGSDISESSDDNGSDNGNEAADNSSSSENNNDNSGDQASGYGRIFFIGDSRTVDMFDGGTEEIYDYNAGGIRVFAKDGCHCAYMQDVTGKYAGEFDTVVSWLGCNDNNDAALYQQVYEYLMSQGKTVVLCTVGPTADGSLSGDFDVANYPNEKMIAFNQSMVSWANSHGVKVIDTYSFVAGNVEISEDGIHYNPKPTTAIWNYIVSNL